MHKEIVKKFCFTQVILMNPIIPHTSDYIWYEILSSNQLMYNSDSVYESIILKIFEPSSQVYSNQMLTDWDYLIDLTKQTQSAITKNSKKKNWSCSKVIFKYDLKHFESKYIENLFEKIIGFPVQVEKLDKVKQYFVFV